MMLLVYKEYKFFPVVAHSNIIYLSKGVPTDVVYYFAKDANSIKLLDCQPFRILSLTPYSFSLDEELFLSLYLSFYYFIRSLYIADDKQIPQADYTLLPPMILPREFISPVCKFVQQLLLRDVSYLLRKRLYEQAALIVEFFDDVLNFFLYLDDEEKEREFTPLVTSLFDILLPASTT